MAGGCRTAEKRNTAGQMVTVEPIMQAVNHRVKRILDVAELSLPPDKFALFRKLTLNEFGQSGLARELERLLSSQER